MELLADWRHGRNFLELYFRTKFDFWQKLPHLLCGGAHWLVQVAQRCLSRAYTEYDQNVASGTKQHRLVHQYCAKSTVLRQQGELFVRGSKSLENLPELERTLFRLLFICVSERGIESKHAFGKASTLIAKNFSEAYYSFKLRLPEMVMEFRKKRSVFAADV